MDTIAQKIFEHGIVPVVKIDDAEKAVPLSRALIRGGIRCIEITFRTAAAERAIKNIAAACPEMLLGAGSILGADQVDCAVAAGAKFIVSPGFNANTAEHCIKKGIPIFPGCNNPTAIEGALALGLTDLKFFPAEQSGGLPMIKALCAPFPQVRFMPTGGINENNMKAYLAYPKVYAVGGSWMVAEELIANDRYEEIAELSQKAVQKMLGYRLQHIGFNCKDADGAMDSARQMADLLGLDVKEGNSSIFAGQEFEMLKQSGIGDNGHICIATNNLRRAYAQLSRRGYAFDEDKARHRADGSLKVFYLRDQIGGFAIHFVEK